MKFYNIMIFILIFNLTLGLVNHMDLFGTEMKQIEEGVQTVEDIKETYNETQTVTSEGGILGDLNWLVQNVRLVITGVGMFIQAMAGAVLVQPMLTNIMCSQQQCGAGLNTLIWIITSIMYLVYVVGIIQLITGRNFPQME